MADRATLLALAERIEAATGPDRELDEGIAFATGWRLQNRIWWKPPGGEWGLDLPAYTASLDAALPLVPEGWSRSTYVIIGKRPSVRLWDGDDGDVLCAAETEVLALCAAALAALAAQAEGGA